jgi:hypothetical protein
MGDQPRTSVRYRGRTEQGKALLETDELIFRGEDGLRLKLLFKSMRSVEARDGELQIDSPQGQVTFALGAQAEKWAHKILNPKSLLDKLGVKPGMLVRVLGVAEDRFLADLRERTDNVVLRESSSSARPTSASGRAGSDETLFDAIFVAVQEPPDLAQLADLKVAIKSDGAVWAIFRKGRKDFHENDVLRGGLAAGLVDVKVVRFSDTHTACKFVIRKAERGTARG